jgi:hypothetical protein
MDTILLAQDSNLKELTNSLQQLPELAEVAVSWSNLGGIPSIFLHLSLDSKSDWINGIFYNSRYAIFTIHSDMKLEQISRHCSLPKHRKCKIDSIQAITDKVHKWAASVPV